MVNTSRKGKAFEQDIVRRFNEAGHTARRTRLSGHGQEKPSDGKVTFKGREKPYTFEGKKRNGAWKELYNWTHFTDFAVLCADRRHPLVVIPLDTFLELLE